jgi:hypothetical protein
VEKALAGLWDPIWNLFKAALNLVIEGWNKLHFRTPSVDFFGVHTPAVDIGMPAIPKLAQGGLITSTGLVYAHAGEAITPMPAGGLGPAVNVEHAHFAHELDVETFMKRAAWVLRTQRV